MIMNFVKKIGGVATGKIAKIGLDMIPFDYTISKISIKNILGALVMYAAAEYFVRDYELKDMIQTGSAVIVGDELEKEVRGLAAPAPAPAPQTVAPKTVIRTPTSSSGGLIIA